MKFKVIGFDIGSAHLFYEHLNKEKDFEIVAVILKNRRFQKNYTKAGIKTILPDKSKISSNNQELVDCRICDVDKKNFRFWNGEKKDHYLTKINASYSKILEELDWDVLIFNQAVENPEGFLLSDIAKKLNKRVAIPHELRFYKRSFWSNSPLEFMVYRYQNVPLNFPKTHNLQLNPPSKPYLLSRVSSLRNINTLGMFLVRIDNIVPFREKIFKGYRKYFLRKKCVTQLPDKFVYYPLQYSPESSINIPSPYYVDQTRAIDLIRYHLPKNCYLVVKEHPAMLGRRKLRFYKELKKKSRVLLVDTDFNSQELIQKAYCTVSVTGTACLEAFLAEKPSICLAKTFFSEFLKNDIENLLEENIHSPTKSDIIYFQNELMSKSLPFLLAAPDFYDIKSKSNFQIACFGLRQFLLYGNKNI